MTDVIGVDLGGTKIALAGLRGHELSESTVEATELSSQDALIDQLARMIEEARGDQLDGVGLGVPSVVEFETGRVVSSANVPLA
ncbi:MAG TPA: ROK family protein, partial [Solirubrobacteraceae bacterium]|nr:ROK family protein [Solirubrobacteraceae bacterium]